MEIESSTSADGGVDGSSVNFPFSDPMLSLSPTAGSMLHRCTVIVGRAEQEQQQQEQEEEEEEEQQ